MDNHKNDEVAYYALNQDLINHALHEHGKFYIQSKFGDFFLNKWKFHLFFQSISIHQCSCRRQFGTLSFVVVALNRSVHPMTMLHQLLLHSYRSVYYSIDASVPHVHFHPKSAVADAAYAFLNHTQKLRSVSLVVFVFPGSLRVGKERRFAHFDEF